MPCGSYTLGFYAPCCTRAFGLEGQVVCAACVPLACTSVIWVSMPEMCWAVPPWASRGAVSCLLLHAFDLPPVALPASSASILFCGHVGIVPPLMAMRYRHAELNPHGMRVVAGWRVCMACGWPCLCKLTGMATGWWLGWPPGWPCVMAEQAWPSSVAMRVACFAAMRSRSTARMPQMSAMRMATHTRTQSWQHVRDPSCPARAAVPTLSVLARQLSLPCPAPACHCWRRCSSMRLQLPISRCCSCAGRCTKLAT